MSEKSPLEWEEKERKGLQRWIRRVQSLGTWFSVGMIGLAGAAILYDTSAISGTSRRTPTWRRPWNCSPPWR